MARAEREPERLNTPGRRKRSILPRPRWDRDTFGAFAEGFARFMGTARFLAWMTVIIICWVLWNVPFGPPRPQFDEYPFIFLTLVLSLQASYAAPLILLAQNRQESRDRVAIERDREQAAQSRADMDYLAREIAGSADVGRRARHPGLPALGAAQRAALDPGRPGRRGTRA